MWTLNGIRIFVVGEDMENSQIIARLNPVGGGTVNQVFGYDEEIRKLSAWVVGDGDMEALKLLTTSGIAVTLSSFDGYEGDYLVKKVSVSRKSTIISQTLRTDLPCDSPVYSADVELYIE